MYTIYIITNSINEKAYVGQTKRTIAERWKSHLNDAARENNILFYNAIRKHGSDVFTCHEILTVETKQEADAAERRWIFLSQSYDRRFGYNCTFGGEGTVPTDDTRLKMRETHLGLFDGEKNPMFGITGPAHPRFGKTFTPETRAQMSASRKKLFQDPEFLREYKIQQTGKKQTDEGRKHISEALMGNQHRKGIPHDEATKRRVSESMKKAYAEGRHGKTVGKMTEEEKLKRSEGMKRVWAERKLAEVGLEPVCV